MFKDQYESLLSARVTALENKKAAQVEFVPLAEELSRLMDEFVANSANAPGPVGPVGTAPGAGANTGIRISPSLAYSELAPTTIRFIQCVA